MQKKIVEAATLLFTSKNYVNVSVREISKVAGVSTAVIYYYFDGKKDLFRAITKAQMNAVLNSLKSCPKYYSPEENVSYFAKTINKYQLFQQNVIKRKLRCCDEFIDKSVNKSINYIYRFLYQVIQRGISSGRFKPGLDIRVIVLLILNITFFERYSQSFSRRLLSKSDSVAYNDHVQQSLTVLFDGIRKN